MVDMQYMKVDFCSIFTIAGVIMGSVKKKVKNKKDFLEVFLIGGNLTELCLYIINVSSNVS